jgi:hypothetical protein
MDVSMLFSTLMVAARRPSPAAITDRIAIAQFSAFIVLSESLERHENNQMAKL